MRSSLHPDPTEDSPEEEMSSLGTLLPPPMRAMPFEFAAAAAAATRARAVAGELLEDAGDTQLSGGGLWLLLRLSLLLFLETGSIFYQNIFALLLMNA